MVVAIEPAMAADPDNCDDDDVISSVTVQVGRRGSAHLQLSLRALRVHNLCLHAAELLSVYL